MKTVRMTNPDLPGQEIEVPETAVPIHRTSGWRTESDDQATTEATPPADKQRLPVNTGKE